MKLSRIRNTRNNKFIYYLKNLSALLVPSIYFRSRLAKEKEKISRFNKEYIESRVNYYNKQEDLFELKENISCIGLLKYPKRGSAYFLDSFCYLRYFDKKLSFSHIWGDVNFKVEPNPSLVKSREIGDTNAVILELDKVRHALYIKDKIPYHDKKDLLVWRGNVASGKPHREIFIKKFFHSSMLDLGDTNSKPEDMKYVKSRLTINEQLTYKFILSIQGNDVATNLRWIMSSNSLCMMTKPKYESWFMEGSLIAGYHYVELNEDYSDLEEKCEFYLAHPEEAKKIIYNAQAHVEQFKNKEREKLISLLILDKYFNLAIQP